MIQKPQKIENFDQLNKTLQDIYNNISIDDLRGTGVRTEAPTTETLDNGKSTIVELSGVPYLYYTTLDGVLYRLTMTAV